MGSRHWTPPSSFLPNTLYESGATPRRWSRRGAPSRANGSCAARRCIRVSKKPATSCLPLLPFPSSQWKALRTTNALERINEEFRRRTKTQASLPNEEAVLLLLFGLLRSGKVRLRRLVGWHELDSSSESTEAA